MLCSNQWGIASWSYNHVYCCGQTKTNLKPQLVDDSISSDLFLTN